MRTVPILTGAALVLVAAGATMAASPSAQPSASPSPSAQPSASPSPAPAASAPGTTSTTSTSAQSWTAAIKPLDQTTGAAKVVEAANGTGTLTITLDGLRANVPWTVDVDGGTLANLRETAANEIAIRTGQGVDRMSNRTVTVHLTKREMRDFSNAVAARGVVVMVSDGVNRSAAAIPKA